MQIQLPMMYPLFYPEDFVNVGYNPFVRTSKRLEGRKFVHPPYPRTSISNPIKPKLTARITPTYVLIRFVEHIRRTGEEAGNAPKVPFS